MELITTTGKTFKIEWIGVSRIDYALRLSIVNEDPSKVFSVFTDAKETKTLVSILDGEEYSRYVNYTVFQSINVEPDGTVLVALRKA